MLEKSIIAYIFRRKEGIISNSAKLVQQLRNVIKPKYFENQSYICLGIEKYPDFIK